MTGLVFLEEKEARPGLLLSLPYEDTGRRFLLASQEQTCHQGCESSAILILDFPGFRAMRRDTPVI